MSIVTLFIDIKKYFQYTQFKISWRYKRDVSEERGVYASICNCDSAHCGSDSAAGDLDLIEC